MARAARDQQRVDRSAHLLDDAVVRRVRQYAQTALRTHDGIVADADAQGNDVPELMYGIGSLPARSRAATTTGFSPIDDPARPIPNLSNSLW